MARHIQDALPWNHMQKEQWYIVTTKSSSPDLCSAHTPALALNLNSLRNRVIFMICLCSWFTNKGSLGPPVTMCSGIAWLCGSWFWFLLFGGRLCPKGQTLGLDTSRPRKPLTPVRFWAQMQMRSSTLPTAFVCVLHAWAYPSGSPSATFFSIYNHQPHFVFQLFLNQLCYRQIKSISRPDAQIHPFQH